MILFALYLLNFVKMYEFFYSKQEENKPDFSGDLFGIEEGEWRLNAEFSAGVYTGFGWFIAGLLDAVAIALGSMTAQVLINRQMVEEFFIGVVVLVILEAMSYYLWREKE